MPNATPAPQVPASSLPPLSTRVNWTTTTFFALTTLLALVATPLFVSAFPQAAGWFHVGLFAFMYVAGMLSLTGGNHRLFAHRAYSAGAPVRLVMLLFSAGTFQYSTLWWCARHRHHHKHADGELDPYNIQRGFWWAHMGWLITPQRDLPRDDNVDDLRKDPLVMWQHRHVRWLHFAMGFGLPTLASAVHALATGRGLGQGLLAGFLVGGVCALVAISQSVFFINSLCHTVGSRPYDAGTSARDSFVMAVLTMGEGYHNYHHTFQHDYRNGVRLHHFDPTKWLVFALAKLGLASNLRRVPDETIRLARLREKRRRLAEHAATGKFTLPERLEQLLASLHDAAVEKHKAFRRALSEHAWHRENAAADPDAAVRFAELKAKLEHARRELHEILHAWDRTHRQLARGQAPQLAA